MSKFRRETDALGPVKVPHDAYYGSFTARALANFRISGLGAPRDFRWALGAVKLAACRANHDLKLLPSKQAKSIEQAAREFMDGKFDKGFTLDVYQAGAGTPFNMNANEIIANRANELLGAPLGSYRFVRPNDHVNMAQSSNDVIPTATRLAVLMGFQALEGEIAALAKSLSAFAKKYRGLVKVGRTHLQDAVPVTLGQEFEAYASAIRTAHRTLNEAQKELCLLGIGGTATGTGINAHPQFKKRVVEHLNKIMAGAEFRGISLKNAPNLIETTHSHSALLKASSALRSLAIEVNRIASDLRLMTSGPKGGFNEIILPEVEPGSSIMPGKVNPSVAECMNMICGQVIGCDEAVSFGVQGGQLELNWHTPLIMLNLLHSTHILNTGLHMFRVDCVDGIRVNEDDICHTFERSLVTATALCPRLGYKVVAECVNEALHTGKNLREVVVRRKKLLSDKEFTHLSQSR